MDLKKFKEESKKHGMPEVAVYLLKRFEHMYSDLSSLVMKNMQHLVVSCKQVTTAGGSSTEEFFDSSVKDGMKCQVTLNKEGASPVSIKTAKCEQGKVVITFSADPGNDHELTYTVCK